jgi:hypothetical protein
MFFFLIRAFVRNFCRSTTLIYFHRVSHRLVNSNDEELVFYYDECKDTWGGPRYLTGVMCSGSRGSCTL